MASKKPQHEIDLEVAASFILQVPTGDPARKAVWSQSGGLTVTLRSGATHTLKATEATSYVTSVILDRLGLEEMGVVQRMIGNNAKIVQVHKTGRSGAITTYCR